MPETLFPLIIVAAIIISIVSLVGWLMRRDEIAWLTQNGRRVDATVIGIQKRYDTQTNSSNVAATNSVEAQIGIASNRQPHYYIIAEWTDPVTNQKQTFKSDRRSSDPGYIKGTTVSVYYHPNNIKRYYVKLR